ncbi:LLM class flavin-dependent oxidoreductase [Phytoactinopolyspora limicola]|uniref:LLM class flavin-dependent oxidoreductase n=1 Tax=Phytoactinopolyspora limicola TaxID=2715536 RepID=UPI001A9CB3EC|nr:LLM class flavin-dependent oxidoreductase [Phytoactinopolyspora limicola]
MRYSIFLPVMPTKLEQLLPFAGLAQWSRAERIWLGHNLTVDTHQVFSGIAAAGFRIPMGVGVTLTPMTHPFAAALHARSVAAISGHPFVAGFGPGAPEVQRAVLGAPYRRPLVAMREYVTAVRDLLAGNALDVEGDYIVGRLRLPVVATSPVEVGLGVLRPGMAKLAGEVADVAITWLTPARYVHDVLLPAMRKGAAEASRPCPRMVVIIPVCCTESGRDVAEVVQATCGLHLAAPHYRTMLLQAGIEVAASNPAVTAERLLSGGAFLAGTADELAGQAAEFAAAGVDELVLNLSGVQDRYGTRATLADLATILSVE